MTGKKGKKKDTSKSNTDDDPKPKPSSSSSNIPNNINILCPDYKKGACKYGSKCKFKHDENAKNKGNKSLNTESQTPKPSNPYYNQFRMFIKKGIYNLTETQHRVLIHAMTKCIADEEFRHRILEVIGTEEGSPIYTYIINCNKKIIIDGRSTDKQISFSRLFIPFLNFSTNKHILDSLQRTYVNPFIQSVISNIDWESLSQALKIVVSRESPIDKSIKNENSDELWTPKTLLDAWMPIVNLSLFIINSFSKEAVEKIEIILDALCQGYSVICEIGEKQNLASSSSSNTYESHFLLKDLKNKFSELQEVMSMKLEQYYDAKELAKRTRELKKIIKNRNNRNKVSVILPKDYPGKSRTDGPRHDNDFADITEIQIIPTENEILCQIPPYLPKNIAGHSPHIPLDGIIPHRDIHFRLLRYDLISQLQRAILYFISNEGSGNIKDNKISVKKREMSDSKDIIVDIYRNVSIGQLVSDKLDGVSFQLEFENLQQLKKKKQKNRTVYWEKSKRLHKNTLACLVYKDDDCDDNNDKRHRILFGTIASRDEELLSQDRPIINFKSHDEETSNLLIDAAFGINDLTNSKIFLLQAGPSFFAYRPILEALKRVPIPFSEYLLSSSEGDVGMIMSVQPPRYLSESRGYYNLTCLVDPKLVSKSKNYTKENLRIVRANDSTKFPDKAISELTTLDESQIEAMKAALMHELALIQGPPGTGKTYVGIQIIRALLSANPNPGPILCVCFTNHALDQFLKGILDCGITNLIRVGGSCKCEELQDYTLREKLYTDTRRDQRYFMHRAKEAAEETSKKIMAIKDRIEQSSHGKNVGWDNLKDCILGYFPSFEKQLLELYDMNPVKAWNKWLNGCPYDLFYDDDYCHGHHEVNDEIPDDAESSNAVPVNNKELKSFNIFQGNEIIEIEDDEFENLADIIETQYKVPDKIDQKYNFEKMKEMNVNEDELVKMESKNRGLHKLLRQNEIWKFSSKERARIYGYFSDMVMELFNEEHYKEELKAKSIKLENQIENLKNIDDDMALTVLLRASVVGMTTTYVAMHQRLLAALKPKIVVVEEAAEVLEAHILTTLSADTQHLILIGDHEQLRPKLESYELQHDSGKGYDLDVSLFERLVVQGKVPHVTLQTQRRMRPAFSNLIRNTIYPKLADHPSVHEYPNKVPGMYHNLYFFDHNHTESSTDEGSSKSNEFEALFAVKLSKYLMLQSAFKNGEIAIVTPYVGQLLKIRKCMSDCHINMFLEEKDKELLQAFGNIDDEMSKESKKSKKKEKMEDLLIEKSLTESVRLATIDNFQGEEAKIIILSLTRNNKDGKIGFVGIKNRANVLLSRAKEGMYILGSAETIRKDKKAEIWHKILDILQEENLVGKSIKLQCKRHENNITEIKDHRDFDTYVPDGGCPGICEEPLSCGHICRRRCHGDDPEHITSKCMEKVTKILKCGHIHFDIPCYRAVAEDILCQMKVKFISEFCPYSHEIDTVCHKAVKLKNDPTACSKNVQITMPTCSHLITVICGHAEDYKHDPTKCNATCGEIIPKCEHACKAKCGGCIDIKGDLNTKKHAKCTAKCGKELPCGHICQKQCHTEDIDHRDVKCKRKVTKVFKCGHEKHNLKCYEATDDNIKCQEKVKVIPKSCPYSHEIDAVCHEVNKFNNKTSCTAIIEIMMPICSHKINVLCGQAKSYSNSPSQCHAICGEIIAKCGHKCGARCGKCIDTKGDLSIKKHVACEVKCKKELPCGHLCKNKCHTGECLPCSEKCAITCGHKPKGCKKICSAQCNPCAEPCLWECEHQGKCLLPCSTPCDRLPCDMRCTKKLECGCQCPSLCGEPCPSRKFCLNHANKEIKNQDVDMILFKKFKDLTQKDINEDPLIVLSCGHAYLTSTLDGIMKIEENYSKDKENKWTSTKSPDPSLEKTETCPKCRALIISPMRYGRRINKTLVDKNERFLIFDFEKRYEKLLKKLNELNSKSIEMKLFERMKKSDKNKSLKQSNDDLYKKFSDLAEFARTPPRFHLFQNTIAAILKLEKDRVLFRKETKLKIEKSGIYNPDMSRQCRAKMGQAKSHLLSLHLYYDDMEDFVNYEYSHANEQSQAKVSENLPEIKNIYKIALNLTKSNLEYYEKTQCVTNTVETRILNIQICIQMYLIISKLCSISTVFKNKYNNYKQEIYNTGKNNGRIGFSIANTEDLRNKMQEKINLLENVKKNANISHLDILSTVLNNEKFDARGHLYTCPNGHIYVIGECGRAMQESRCPECNAPIGGQRHTLTAGNQAADHIIEQLN